MSTDPRPGWSRYWCLRCRRALSNDPSMKRANYMDRVSYHEGRFTHDHCGGEVALSSRDVAV